MRILKGKCARGHVVDVIVDDEGDVRANIGTGTVDPSGDPNWNGEDPIVVACNDCVAEVERLAKEAGVLPS